MINLNNNYLPKGYKRLIQLLIVFGVIGGLVVGLIFIFIISFILKILFFWLMQNELVKI